MRPSGVIRVDNSNILSLISLCILTVIFSFGSLCGDCFFCELRVVFDQIDLLLSWEMIQILYIRLGVQMSFSSFILHQGGHENG